VRVSRYALELIRMPLSSFGYMRSEASIMASGPQTG